MSPTFSFAIDIPVRSDWANVDLLRTSVQNCFTAVFSDIDGCHTLAMVTGELLENAIKYGDWTGNEGGHFRLRVWGAGVRPGSGRSAHVSVENPIKGGDPGVARVLETLEWIKTFPSAKDAYRARLLEIAQAPATDEEGHLGLVRIAYEGCCSLTAEVEGGVLRVTADSAL
jgi:hypothetical protein